MNTKPSFPLPQDWHDAVLVGRLDLGEGPTPVVVKNGRVFDVSAIAPTVSQLIDGWKGIPESHPGAKERYRKMREAKTRAEANIPVGN